MVGDLWRCTTKVAIPSHAVEFCHQWNLCGYDTTGQGANGGLLHIPTLLTAPGPGVARVSDLVNFIRSTNKPGGGKPTIQKPDPILGAWADPHPDHPMLLTSEAQLGRRGEKRSTHWGRFSPTFHYGIHRRASFLQLGRHKVASGTRSRRLR